MNFFDGLIQRQQALKFEVRVEMYDPDGNLLQVNRDKEVYVSLLTRGRALHEGFVSYTILLYEKSCNRITPIFEGDVEFSTTHELLRVACKKASDSTCSKTLVLVYVSQSRNFEIVNMVS